MKSHYAKQIIYEKEAAKLIGTNVIDINNFKKIRYFKNNESK